MLIFSPLPTKDACLHIQGPKYVCPSTRPFVEARPHYKPAGRCVHREEAWTAQPDAASSSCLPSTRATWPQQRDSAGNFQAPGVLCVHKCNLVLAMDQNRRLQGPRILHPPVLSGCSNELRIRQHTGGLKGIMRAARLPSKGCHLHPL